MACKLSLMDMVKRVMERLDTLRSTQQDRERLKTAVSEEINRWYQESTGQSLPITIVPRLQRGAIKTSEYHRCGHPFRQDFPALFL